MLKSTGCVVLLCLLSSYAYAEPSEDQLYPYPYNQQTSVMRDQPYPYSPLPTQVYPSSQQPQDFYPYGQRTAQIYYGYNRPGYGCSCGR